MLKSEEVLRIVYEEIESNFDISNSHGVDLTKCLIAPVRQRYISSLDDSVTFELWTVLEEREDGNGYKIFYDENEKSFGLGMKGFKGDLIYLGYYGTFLETLKGM